MCRRLAYSLELNSSSMNSEQGMRIALQHNKLFLLLREERGTLFAGSGLHDAGTDLT
jgi:hypothetical protein